MIMWAELISSIKVVVRSRVCTVSTAVALKDGSYPAEVTDDYAEDSGPRAV